MEPTLTPEQKDAMRLAIRRAVSETSGGVHFVVVAPQPDGRECPTFTVLSMADGQRCVVLPKSWLSAGHPVLMACEACLKAEIYSAKVAN